MRFLKNKFTVYYLLFVLVLLGAFLRFYNLDWDKGYFFHPDERNVAAAVARIRFFDQLNPGFFAYGGFLVYLIRAVGEVLVFMTGKVAWVSDWGHINFIGRAISATSATMAIPLIFVLVKRLLGNVAALLATALFSFTPFLIQTAHFGVTESLLILWLLLVSIFSLEILEKPQVKSYLWAGVVLGIATATKITALSFLITPVVAHFLDTKKSGLIKRQRNFLILIFSAFSVFVIFSPYTFLNWQKFQESMLYETGVATGRLPVPYTLQFEKTSPFLFQFRNFFWQIGPVAAVSLLGAILLLISAIRTKNKKLLVLLSFPLVYFLYVGSWHTKFLRFMIPLLPFLSIFAAWFLAKVWKRWKVSGTILIATVLTITVAWTLAFFSIYTRPQTRIAASRWIYQNIPEGSKILGEHWDDGLPISLGPFNPGQYDIEQLTIYEPDNENKINYYAETLSGGDFIVINSRRLYGTLMNLPEKYPITSRYYKLLLGGKLGYEKVAEFTSYPLLFGIGINDDASEETLQVYDHPKVLILKNAGRLTREDIANILFQNVD